MHQNRIKRGVCNILNYMSLQVIYESYFATAAVAASTENHDATVNDCCSTKI